MDAKAFQKYLDSRYHDSLRWYQSHANQARQLYVALQGYAIVGAAAVPVLLSIGDIPVALSGAIGASVAAVQGLVVLLRSHDNWINYRSAVHSLSRELALYQTGAGPYADASDREKLFVERVEAAIATEEASWDESASNQLDGAPTV